MNLKNKTGLFLFFLSGTLVYLLTLTSGNVYAGGVISEGVYGDLAHKKTKKPTFSARTATQTQTLTPTITKTPTPTSTPTQTTTSLPTDIPTKTKNPISIDDAEGLVMPPIIAGPTVVQPSCKSPAAMVIGFAGIMWMKLRKRKDDI